MAPAVDWIGAAASDLSSEEAFWAWSAMLEGARASDTVLAAWVICSFADYAILWIWFTGYPLVFTKIDAFEEESWFWTLLWRAALLGGEASWGC